jgi:hypothetical protein
MSRFLLYLFTLCNNFVLCHQDHFILETENMFCRTRFHKVENNILLFSIRISNNVFLGHAVVFSSQLPWRQQTFKAVHRSIVMVNVMAGERLNNLHKHNLSSIISITVNDRYVCHHIYTATIKRSI